MKIGLLLWIKSLVCCWVATMGLCIYLSTIWQSYDRLAIFRSLPKAERPVQTVIALAISAPRSDLEALAGRAARLCGIGKDVFWSLIMVESSGRHYNSKGRVLRSSAGAIGAVQIKPGTARMISPTLDIYTEWGNVVAGACELRQLFDKRNDIRLALMDYRLGPNRTSDAPEYADAILTSARSR